MVAPNLEWLLLAHAATTLAMTGLIWFVQVVHYPLFPLARENDFCAFAEAHQRLTARVVIPLMLVELGAAVALVFSSAVPPRLSWTGAALLAMIWVMTAGVQVPLHRRLASGFDLRSAERLVQSNWGRTLAWTARSVLALRMLAVVEPG